MTITLAQAKALRSGTTLYSTRSYNRQAQPHRVKVTSVKTWKTRPDAVLVKWKFGLYDYGSFDQSQLDHFALSEEEALAARA